MLKFRFSSLAFCLLLFTVVAGQELPRSAWFGAAVIDLTDSSRTALKLSSPTGTLIKKVIPGSSANKAGLMEQDVLVSMNGEKIENTNHFLSMLKKLKAEDKVIVGYYRNSALQEMKMTLLSRPMETSEDFEIIYSAVKSGSNHLRTIITKPKSGSNFPAVMLIGGIGCYSIDNITLNEIKSMKLWVDSLTRNGFVTIRVEKTGIGDSRGIPCKDCDFITEKQGYTDGLKQLKSLPYVDKDKVFIAGFSIGGIVAPVIAEDNPVKGIIVYGTAGRNWFEYEIDNALRQQVLEGKPDDSIDTYMRAEYIRLYGLMVEKKKPEQIMSEHPETRPNFFPYPMRIEYFQQVADVNIREVWMKTSAKVLALHGASDFVSSATEHQMIADIVNKYHPGNAEHIEVADSDHWSFMVKSEKESLLHQTTTLNALPLTISMKWLKENL